MEHCVSSFHHYEGRVLNLRVDNVRLVNGRSTIREVVEHRGASAIVPLIDDREVILVRQYRYAVKEYLLEIPAGTLEPGESPEDCAKRELEEETGYECSELQKILECFIAPGYSTEKIHFYLATKLIRSVTKTEEDEQIKVETLPIQLALQKIRTHEIRDTKTICALFLASELTLSR